MSSPDFSIRRVFLALVFTVLLAVPANSQASNTLDAAPAAASEESLADQQRLAGGEVVVDTEETAGIRYVCARIWMDDTVENTWRTLVNPFEFEGRICRRMKNLLVLTDLPSTSVLDCTVGVMFPIPDFRYVVESHYTPCSRVEFHRISGSFKDFRGYWELAPVAGGSKTEVTYAMYLDPGFPAPDWLVRAGIRCELPSVLTNLKARLAYLKNNADDAEKRTLQAALATTGGPPPKVSTLPQPLVPLALEQPHTR